MPKIALWIISVFFITSCETTKMYERPITGDIAKVSFSFTYPENNHIYRISDGEECKYKRFTHTDYMVEIVQGNWQGKQQYVTTVNKDVPITFLMKTIYSKKYTSHSIHETKWCQQLIRLTPRETEYALKLSCTDEGSKFSALKLKPDGSVVSAGDDIRPVKCSN